MYNPIQLTNPYEATTRLTESFSLDPLKEAATPEQIDLKLYTEAVFSGGKEKLKPIVDQVSEIKQYLEDCIKEENESIAEMNKWAKQKARDRGPRPRISKFDPKAFWRSTLFKDLEDKISEIFGFRNVEIHPFIEKYDSKTKTFESKILNCEIWHRDRYPVEGLVTDNGFFDRSHSLTMEIHISLGLIQTLSAEEIVAVLLHEFGHGIDPALVNIKYTQTNILSKYLTDRKGSINKHEKKFMQKHNLTEAGAVVLIYLIIFLAMSLSSLFTRIKNFLLGKTKDDIEREKVDKIRAMVKRDRSEFTRQEYTEAYADNFARMYGFGPQLIRALKKIEKSVEKFVRSRIKKEEDRQDAIISMTIDCLNDEHKTDIHRIRALLKEYDTDINDPNTSPVVKKQLEEDKEELEKVLDEYLNNFSRFQNRVNRAINSELIKKEAKNTKPLSANEKVDKKKDKPIAEGVEFFEESKKGYEQLVKAEKSLNPQERSEIKKKFGQTGCSFGKDKDGYYCFTHRCRSKSYPKIDDIPQKDVDFVNSTC